MQKKIIALAIAGLASTAAFAQSNVTIYGIADVGYAHMREDGKKSMNNVDSGLLAGSRIGFKGVEDLGNGLKALFTLEYALALDANSGLGYADTPWSSTTARQQFAGLASNMGTLIAGRLQTAGYDFACAYSPVAGGAFNTTDRIGAATVISCGSGGRANNAVAYVSPSFGGVTVALNHAQLTESKNAVGNTTGENTRADLVQVSYNNGPASASVIYSKVNGGDSVNGINGSATIVANDIREYGVGASYDLKVVKLSALYQNQKSHAASALQGKNDSKWSVGAAVPVGSAGTVLASYAHSYINQTSAPDNVQAATLAYTHALSKRTKLYAGYTFLKNDNAATKSVYGSTAAGTGNFAPDAGGNGSIIGAGINHAF